MPTLRVSVPDSICQLLLAQPDDGADTPGSLARKVKQRLALALQASSDSDDAQSPPFGTATTSCVVFLSDAQLATLSSLAKPRGLTPPQFAEALVWTHCQHDLSAFQPPTPAAPDPTLAAPLEAVNARLGLSNRPEQARYAAALEQFAMDESDRPGVLFAEASTGVGKTRSYLTTLIHWVGAHPDQVAGVAVPTYALMSQVLQEWKAMEAVGPMPPYRVVVGQAAFVSLSALRQWVEQSDDSDVLPAVKAWIAAGGPSRPGSLTQHLPWTFEGLEHACGLQFEDANDVGLDSREDDEDPAWLAYQSQVRLAKGATPPGTVVFMTHAMLAVTVRDRIRTARSHLGPSGEATLQEITSHWVALDPSQREAKLHELINAHLVEHGESDQVHVARFGLLVIDEAHELERWFASISSLQLSVWRSLQLLGELRSDAPRIPAQLLTRAHAVFETMRLQHGLPPSGDSVMSTVGQLVDIIQDALQSATKRARATRAGRSLQSVATMLELGLRRGPLALRVPNLMRVRMDWSEGRHWPRIVAGRRSVAPMLEFLWSHVAHRAILVSATLYDEMPQLSSETMRSILAVPQALHRPMSPVLPPWVFAPVSLYAASLTYRPDSTPRYVRPKREESPSFEAAYAAWLDDVAAYIVSAANSAAGGTLVALTSYADLAALSDRLAVIWSDDRLLLQRSGRSLEPLRHQFLALARGARPKPVLMGVGSVWTGLNLHDPENPDALTDMIIPVAPFGVTRSVTQEERERFSPIMAAWMATMTLRQGTGRLVRQPDLPPNRRLHFLDARLHQPGAAGMYAPLKRWLAKYPRVFPV